MGLRSWLRGENSLNNGEERALAPGKTSTPWLVPYSREGLLDVNESNSLKVADAYACVRVLADSIASLPLKVFRRTPQGRVPAGDSSRAVQLLERPSPGSTSADLISQIMVHLNVHGNAYLAKYRSQGEIVQLGLLDPYQVQPELRGQRIVYVLTLDGRRSEHGPEDVLHIKAMGSDGLVGLSPVAQCRLALSLSANLVEHSRQYFDNASHLSGVLNVSPHASIEALDITREDWRAKHGEGVRNQRAHTTAVIRGDATYTPISFSPDDSQFLQQRELSAREVARIFRVPGHLINADTAGSFTYANVVEENRHFVTHSLRPWLVRIERALSNDADLCPGSTYVAFDLDGLLRANTTERYEAYRVAKEGGWLTLPEIRELEDLPPLPDASPEPEEQTNE
jgi:HK97 family phage portal protein